MRVLEKNAPKRDGSFVHLCTLQEPYSRLRRVSFATQAKIAALTREPPPRSEGRFLAMVSSRIILGERRATLELEPHEGVILRVNEQGLGIVKDTHSQEQFVFTFDKIIGYRGESARELGLIAGAHVRFNATAGTQVVSVELRP